MNKSNSGHRHHQDGPRGARDGEREGELEGAGSKADKAPASSMPDNVVEKLEAESADLKDRLLRALADAENIRRRAQRDVDDAKQFGIAAFARDILRVADNLGRALTTLPPAEQKTEATVKTLIEGIELTEKDLQQILERHGVRKLLPVGEKFDPNFHEALFTVPDASVPPGTVSKVVEPGYAIGSRPLRPAKVGIAASS